MCIVDGGRFHLDTAPCRISARRMGSDVPWRGMRTAVTLRRGDVCQWGDDAEHEDRAHRVADIVLVVASKCRWRIVEQSAASVPTCLVCTGSGVEAALRPCSQTCGWRWVSEQCLSVRGCA